MSGRAGHVRQLVAALVSACPSLEALEHFVQYEFSEHCAALGAGSREDRAFDLCQALESRGHLTRLPIALILLAPDNPVVRGAFEAALCAQPGHPDLLGTIAALRSGEHANNADLSAWLTALPREVVPDLPRDVGPFEFIALSFQGVRCPALLAWIVGRRGLPFWAFGHDALTLYPWREGADGGSVGEAVQLLEEVHGIGLCDAGRAFTGEAQVRAGLPGGTGVEAVRQPAPAGEVAIDKDTGALRSASLPARLVCAMPPLRDVPAWRFPRVMQGREYVIDGLIECVRRAIDQGSGPRRALPSMLVNGEPGAGKSRVRHEALRRLEALRTQDPQRWPVAALLVPCRDEWRPLDFAALRDALRGHVCEELLQACDVPKETADGRAPSPTSCRARRERVRDLLRALARDGGLVLAIDDAHHLDDEALLWIDELRANPPDYPLALWFFAETPVPERCAALAPRFEPVERLRPLRPEEARSLVTELSVAVPEAVIEHARGNPLFLTELVHFRAYDAGPLPDSVEGCFHARLARMSPLECCGVRAAAWFEEGFALDDVDATARETFRPPEAPPSVARGDYAAALRLLVGDILLPPGEADAGGPVYKFRSAHFRRLLREQVTLDERVRFRAAVKRAQTERPPPAPPSIGDAGAPHDAQDARRRFASLRDRDNGYMLRACHDLRVPVLLEMEALARALGGAAVAEVLWRLCHHARMTNGGERARALGERAVEAAREAADRRQEAHALVELAKLYQDEDRHEDRRRVIGRLAELAAGEEDPAVRASIHNAVGYTDLETGSAARARAAFERAAADFACCEDAPGRTIALVNRVYALIRLGLLDEADRALPEVLATARRIRNERTVAVALHDQGLIARIRGTPHDLARAADNLQEAAHAASHLQHVRLVAAATTDLAYLAIQCGDNVDTALARAVAAAEFAARAGSPNLTSAALACQLRATRLAGLRCDDLLPRALDAAANRVLAPEYRAELWLAIHAATPSPDHLRRAEEALEEAVALADPPPEARADCLRVLRRRYLAPDPP